MKTIKHTKPEPNKNPYIILQMTHRRTQQQLHIHDVTKINPQLNPPEKKIKTGFKKKYIFIMNSVDMRNIK